MLSEHEHYTQFLPTEFIGDKGLKHKSETRFGSDRCKTETKDQPATVGKHQFVALVHLQLPSGDCFISVQWYSSYVAAWS